MKRIILYTGKGGVGKTTAAAATALQSAKRGHKTLVISTDPAHSLRDSFDIEIGPEPKKIMKNLYAQEIDVFYSVDKYWGKLTGYIQSLFNWMKVDDVLAEEFSIFPGMEEVSCFLWVYSHFREGDYDVIIVDSAPTGETLRLLSLPDVARWWIVKVFPIERKLLKVVRPAVKVVSDMPLPEEETYSAIEDLFEKLKATRLAMARAAGVPAYAIFHNSTLEFFTRLRPRTIEAALRIRGVSESKAAHMVEPFLVVIRDHDGT